MGTRCAGKEEIPLSQRRAPGLYRCPLNRRFSGAAQCHAAHGWRPKKVNPLVPVDLVVDHSVQVDQFGSELALYFNAELEFERNRERYEFLRVGTGRV